MKLITTWRVDGARDAIPLDHCIRLHRFAASQLPATKGRWRSFGCRVLDERSPDEPPITDEEILNLAEITQ